MQNLLNRLIFSNLVPFTSNNFQLTDEASELSISSLPVRFFVTAAPREQHHRQQAAAVDNSSDWPKSDEGDEGDEGDQDLADVLTISDYWPMKPLSKKLIV